MPFLIVALTSLLATTSSAPPRAPNKAPAQSDSVTCDKPQPPTARADNEPPPMPAQKAAQAAYAEYHRSVLRSLRSSAAPRDRALAIQMGDMVDMWDGHEPTPADRVQRGAMLRAAAAAAPDDTLVQWLWVQASPEDSGCDVGRPCPHRLEALARVQPDNGSAWVPVFSAAWQAKDIPAAETALANMARATYFDEKFGETVRAWVEMFHRYPVPTSAFDHDSPEARLDPQTLAFENAFSYAAATSFPAYQGPINACRREEHPDASPQRFRDCAQVGRSMLAHSRSLISSQIGRALLRVSGQATAADIANARVVDWQYEQWQKLLPGQPGHENDSLKETGADWLETGDEIQVMQRQLQRAGIPLTPPANWQPHGRDGNPTSPLGEPPASAKTS